MKMLGVFRFLLVFGMSLQLFACGGGGNNAANTQNSANNSNGNSTQLELAPTIITQAHAISVLAGANASFSVQASSTLPMSYQWQKNGIDVPGANDAKLELTNLQLSDNESHYSVLISNRVGSVRSNSVSLQVYQALSLLAGETGGGDGNIDGIGRNAHFYNPNAMVFDASGNLYVADSGNLLIRKITPQAVVSTIAGSNRQSGAQDGQGKQARFASMTGMVMGPNGNLYLADYVNQTIRMITTDGVVSTVAGAAGQVGNNDGAALQARFSSPLSISFDPAGNLLILQQGAIRKLSPQGIVTTLIKFTEDISENADTIFCHPIRILADQNANVLVADYTGNRIRKVSPAGVITHVYGNTGACMLDSDSTANTANVLNRPTSMMFDPSGNLIVVESGAFKISKITPEGLRTTLADSKTINDEGLPNGLNNPNYLAMDALGNLFVSETGYESKTVYVSDISGIRKITPKGIISDFAGGARKTGLQDGMSSSARFTYPSGLTVDQTGQLYLQDGDALRKISAAGEVTTLPGTAGKFGFSIEKMATDQEGNLYYPDRVQHTIMQRNLQGQVNIIAGQASVTGGSQDGTALKASFNTPVSVVRDAIGNLFVSDYRNHTIRKISKEGQVSTFAGLAGVAGSADGIGGTARFDGPARLALDVQGNLYVADSNNSTIRKISNAGVVSTLAGKAGVAEFSNGTGAAAHFDHPLSLAVDKAGNVYVAEGGRSWDAGIPTVNYAVRKITPQGVVSIIAGVPGMSGIQLGGLPGSLDFPTGIAIDADDVLYLSFATCVLKLRLQ